MMTSIAAYCDDERTITVDVSRNFYQGDAGKFYLEHEDGKIEECKIRQIQNKQNLTRYTLETFEIIEVGGITDKKGYNLKISIDKYTNTYSFSENMTDAIILTDYLGGNADWYLENNNPEKGDKVNETVSDNSGVQL